MSIRPSPNMRCALRLRAYAIPFSPMRWPWGGVEEFWTTRVAKNKTAANLRPGQIA